MRQLGQGGSGYSLAIVQRRRAERDSGSALRCAVGGGSPCGHPPYDGDFATGDFTGWTTDTDGGPGSSSDLRVSGSPGAYRAQLDADYWSVPGTITSTPLNTVLFANSLSQGLDTALSTGAAMRLTFDWLFTGEDGDATSGDIFSVALNDGLGNLYGADGLLGFLIDPATLYGSGSFSAVLDRTRFGNQCQPAQRQRRAPDRTDPTRRHPIEPRRPERPGHHARR